MNEALSEKAGVACPFAVLLDLEHLFRTVRDCRGKVVLCNFLALLGARDSSGRGFADASRPSP